MKTRKLVLIIADALLLALCIVQGILKASDGAKHFDFKETPDEITITTPAETLSLTSADGENWLASGKYSVNKSTIDNFIETSSSIRALNKVATANDSSLAKYELVDGKKISVEVRKAGKVLRSFEIGKAATSSSQAYVTIDGKKDIYLASGNLRGTFDATLNSIRTKTVWDFDTSTMDSLAVTKADGTSWTLSRMGSGDDIAWNFSDSSIELDTSKAGTILNGAANLTASTWYDDSVKAADLGGQFYLSAKVGHDYKTASLEIYKIPAADENSSDKYYAVSSETPYTFEVAVYSVNKFDKTSEDLKK